MTLKDVNEQSQHNRSVKHTNKSNVMNRTIRTGIGSQTQEGLKRGSQTWRCWTCSVPKQTKEREPTLRLETGNL